MESGSAVGEHFAVEGAGASLGASAGAVNRRRMLLAVGLVMAAFGVAFAAGRSTRAPTASSRPLAPVAALQVGQPSVVAVAPVQAPPALRLAPKRRVAPRAHGAPQAPAAPVVAAASSSGAPVVSRPAPSVPTVSSHPIIPAPAPAPTPAPVPVSSPTPSPPSSGGGTGSSSGGGGGSGSGTSSSGSGTGSGSSGAGTGTSSGGG